MNRPITLPGMIHFSNAKSPHSRRRFLRALAGAALGAAALRRHALAAVEEPSSFGPIIDMHTHLGQDWWEQKPGLTASDLLHWMDQHQIAKAVVLPLISPESWAYPVTTDYVLKETKQFRDRLIPFCVVDPRTINLGGVKGMTGILKRYRDAGAKGFGEHKPGVAMDDPRNMRLYEACAEVKLPVLFHLDNHRNFDEPGLPGLEKVLQSFPDLPFIGHAPGWWANISGDVTQEEMGGYPNSPVTRKGAIDRLMDRYPNIYGELSAGSGANAIQRDLEFGRQFLIRRADRILFGSDYLTPGQEIPQFSLLKELFPSPEEARLEILRKNAMRILEL